MPADGDHAHRHRPDHAPDRDQDQPDLRNLRDLLAGTAGWWSSARVALLEGGDLLAPGAARALLRRPLMGVPAGVRLEDAEGGVLARALGVPLDEHGTPLPLGTGVGAALDPLALVTGLPPAVGALPSRERRAAVAGLVVGGVEDVVVDGRPCVRGTLGGLRAGRELVVVVDAASGLLLRAAPPRGELLLSLRLEELDPRLDDEVFSG
ncbi:hypothetical protein [uncultured Pseudokineococcus sp.]|uniref:hypothetical protein n=1 Tax=uncultured Pseudokineococcus sp. TaxID=1642928 RepID=UPI002605A2B2|nr:hypothetical protein [uncultured Pseudokineococcus sp.]